MATATRPRIGLAGRIGGEAWTWLTTGALLAAGSLYPEAQPDLLLATADGLAALLPVVLGASLLAGALAAGAWADRAMAAVRGNTMRAVGIASIAGALTPVCGLGVLPLITALLRRGLPLAPVMAFWVSSPVMGPSMVLVTIGVLGTEFAVAKALAAVGCGLFAGAVTGALPGRGGSGEAVLRPDRSVGVGCENAGFWRETWNSARLVLRWLALALVLELLLQRLVPIAWIESLFGTGNPASVPLAAVVGAPLYVDGYAALPLVRGLMDMGMGFGAALAFMVAGASVSLYAAVAVAAIVRARVFVLYVALAMAGATISGFAAEWVIQS